MMRFIIDTGSKKKKKCNFLIICTPALIIIMYLLILYLLGCKTTDFCKPSRWGLHDDFEGYIMTTRPMS